MPRSALEHQFSSEIRLALSLKAKMYGFVIELEDQEVCLNPFSDYIDLLLVCFYFDCWWNTDRDRVRLSCLWSFKTIIKHPESWIWGAHPCKLNEDWVNELWFKVNNAHCCCAGTILPFFGFLKTNKQTKYPWFLLPEIFFYIICRYSYYWILCSEFHWVYQSEITGNPSFLMRRLLSLLITMIQL